MDILVDCPFIILVFTAIRPARINWVQSLYRPTHFNGLQYHSGRGPLARMVQQIVKPGIRYGTGNSTEWSGISKSKNLVTNFAGGSLPRCDRGDREYYCATMLTLFKPWRHGKNLKEDDQSWDEAFTNYKFTPRQIELMKFFNIRYECNDARDDYSKLLKQKNATDGVFPHWFKAD